MCVCAHACAHLCMFVCWSVSSTRPELILVLRSTHLPSPLLSLQFHVYDVATLSLLLCLLHVMDSHLSRHMMGHAALLTTYLSPVIDKNTDCAQTHSAVIMTICHGVFSPPPGGGRRPPPMFLHTLQALLDVAAITHCPLLIQRTLRDTLIQERCHEFLVRHIWKHNLKHCKFLIKRRAE